MSNETKRQHTPRRRPDRYRRGYHSDKTSEDTVRRTNGTISVVIPLLNEAESLEILAAKLEKVLQSLAPDKWEVLFIDDGSTDNSFEVIQNLHSRNSKYKCIRFRTNHGKSAALAVGFMYVKGTYVITMDADLQDDPDEIPALISKLEGGYDLVSGWNR